MPFLFRHYTAICENQWFDRFTTSQLVKPITVFFVLVVSATFCLIFTKPNSLSFPFSKFDKGRSINDVPRFLAFFDLPMSHLVPFGKSCLFNDVFFCLTYPPKFFFWCSNSNYSNLRVGQFFGIKFGKGESCGGYVLWRHKISTWTINLVVRIRSILKREISKRFFFPF